VPKTKSKRATKVPFKFVFRDVRELSRSIKARFEYIPTLRDIRKLWLRTPEGRSKGILDGSDELRHYIADTALSSVVRIEKLRRSILEMELGRQGQELDGELITVYGEVEFLAHLSTFLYCAMNKDE